MIRYPGPPRFFPTADDGAELRWLQLRRLRQQELRDRRLARAIAGGLRLLADALDPPRTYMTVEEGIAEMDAWADNYNTYIKEMQS